MIKSFAELLKRLQPYVLGWAFPAYQDWTPTVTQSGAVTVTVNEAKYSLRGNQCHIYAYLTVTGSGTGNNVIVVAGVPTACTMAFTSTGFANGEASVFDSGVGFYVGMCGPANGTAFKFMADGQNNYIGVAPNFALAANDLIAFTATYRV